MTNTAFVPESEFAERLGLPRKAVSEVRSRALEEGRHFRRNEEANGRVELTSEGAAIVMHELQLGSGETPAPAESRPRAVLIVVRQVPNARQVLAVREGDESRGQLVLKVPVVEVPRKMPNGTVIGKAFINHFRPHNRVMAEHVEGATWTFVGKKPRWPGDLASLAPKAAAVVVAKKEEDPA